MTSTRHDNLPLFGAAAASLLVNGVVILPGFVALLHVDTVDHRSLREALAPDVMTSEPPPPEIILGAPEASRRPTLTWIGHTTYEEQFAEQAEVEQAAFTEDAGAEPAASSTPTPPQPESVVRADAPTETPTSEAAPRAVSEPTPTQAQAQAASTSADGGDPAGDASVENVSELASTERAAAGADDGAERSEAAPVATADGASRGAVGAATDGATAAGEVIEARSTGADGATEATPAAPIDAATPAGPGGDPLGSAETGEPGGLGSDRGVASGDAPLIATRTDPVASATTEGPAALDASGAPAALDPAAAAAERAPVAAPRVDANRLALRSGPLDAPFLREAALAANAQRLAAADPREGADPAGVSPGSGGAGPAAANQPAGDTAGRLQAAAPAGSAAAGAVGSPASPASAASDAGASGDASNRSSAATSLIKVPPEQWKQGKPIVDQGIEITTSQPAYLPRALVFARPMNPQVEIEFQRDGQPKYPIRLLRSTGDAGVDEPILNSLYRWTARGPRIDALRPGQTLKLRFTLLLSN